VPLEKKLAEMLQRQGLAATSPDMESFLNQASRSSAPSQLRL
jgi:hypothetical protein